MSGNYSVGMCLKLAVARSIGCGVGATCGHEMNDVRRFWCVDSMVDRRINR